MHPLDDTIAAVASASGGAARGILRISGPQAPRSVAAVFAADGLDLAQPPERPTVAAGQLRAEAGMASVPCDLYRWPHGRSYTGQPVAELHTLGCPPLLEAALQSLCAAGARLAEPGEFTLRAFLSGRIDLTQAEAVLGVIDAAGRRQLDTALAQLAGGLAGPLRRLREALLDLLAHLEAGFDFADEDLSFITPQQLQRELDEAARRAAALAEQMRSRGAVASDWRAVLVGPPNAGKSSLFNALTQTAGALVSKRPGATRDYLTAELDLDGVRCQLVDMAGMERGERAREARGEREEAIDDAAQSVAGQQRARADVEVVCVDAACPTPTWQRDLLSAAAVGQRVVVLTKVDAAPGAAGPEGAILTSSLSGQGIAAAREALRGSLLAAQGADAGAVAGTAVRCRDSLRRADESLRRARGLVQNDSGEELVAAEVRAALDELGKVAGAVYTDDILDRIFSRFCVGK